MASISETNRLLIVVCIIFLSVGMSQGAIGPVLQDIASQTGSTLVAASATMTAIFAGSLAAQTLTAFVLKSVGHRPIMLIGMLCFLVGIVGITTANALSMLLIAGALKGAGDGAMLLVGNVLAAEASKGAGPLNLVNAMFGVGAIISPAVVSLAMVQFETGVPGLWVVPCAMAVALALLLVWHPRPARRRNDGQAPLGMSRPSEGASVIRTKLVWFVAGFALLEVCLEVGITTWLPTLLHQAAGLPLTAGSLTLSWFWLLITGSRFTAAWLSRHISPITMLIGLSVVAVLGTAIMVAAIMAGSSLWAIVGMTLVAPAIGPILPTALSVLRAAYPHNAGAATGIAFGSCNFAGAFVPPLLGLLIVQVGVGAGAGTLLVFATSMLGVLLVVSRLMASRGQSAASQHDTITEH